MKWDIDMYGVKMERIIVYLKRFSTVGNPISGKDLACHFGITGVKVREYINNARCDGIPICSTRWGYFYSEDRDQIEKTVLSMRGRISAQENAIAGLSTLLA